MHQEEYKGHTITVDTMRRSKGWSWNYQIDGDSIRSGGDRPLRNEELARKEAIGAAKRAIDGMA